MNMDCDNNGDDSDGFVENEEWDRENFLDPAWEAQQKKSFTAWCNSRLRHVGAQIDDITEDFQDGLMLMQLLEVISNESLPKPERGKLRFHKIANVNKALDFICSKGVKLACIGAEEIVDGNVKMTLGMIWTIILRFSIQDITVEDMTAKQGLLLWCQRKTNTYKHVNVLNFHTSFKDGLAFCALIHRHRPDLIDMDSLSKDNALENLKYAFEVAEKYLDIPKMLDPEDMVNNAKPDERSVMAYVSCYYHAFSDAQKTESAAKRISKMVQLTREKEDLVHTYETLTARILIWLKEKVDFLQDRHLDEQCAVEAEESGLPLVLAKRSEFNVYHEEKMRKLEEKASAESALHRLQTRLQLSNRPPYQPPAGHHLDDMNHHWEAVQVQEKEFETWLLVLLKRLERLDILVRRFRHRCDTHDQWVQTIKLLFTFDLPTNLSDARALLHRQKTLQSLVEVQTERVSDITEMLDEFRQMEYKQLHVMVTRVDQILVEWTEICTNWKTQLETVEKALTRFQEIDTLQVEYADKAAELYSNLEQSLKDCEDVLVLRSIQEVEEAVELHETLKVSLPMWEEKLELLTKLWQKIETSLREVVDDAPFGAVNPYTHFSPEVLELLWKRVQVAAPQLESELQNELSRRRSQSQLRVKLEEESHHFNEWLERQHNAVKNSVLVGHQGQEEQLHEQREFLAMTEGQVVAMRAKLDRLRAIEEQCDFNDEDSSSSSSLMSSLRGNWQTLYLKVRRSSSQVESEILIQDSRNGAEEQLKEYQKCFRHFDKNKSHKLDHVEFKACLVSMEYIVNGAEDQENADFKRILAHVDPDNTGYVTLEAFLEFMSQEVSDTVSNDLLLNSFKALAQEKCYITADTLRRCLSLNEAEYCIERMKPYTNSTGDSTSVDTALDYTTFTAMLLSEEFPYKNGENSV